MTGTHTRWVYFALLCLATLAMASAAAFWLGREQDRLESQLALDTRIKAQAMVDRWGQALEARQTAIMTELRLNFASGNLDALLEFRDTRPEIRNVFLWDPFKGARVSFPGQQLSIEERRFLQRFQSLFSIDSNFAREPVSDQPPVSSSSYRAEPEQFGWLVWYWEDQFSWLGWVRSPSMDTQVVGVELESSYLLSIAIPQEDLTEKDVVLYRVLDQKGTLFHQTGGLPTPETPMVEMPLGKTLPGWVLQASVTAPAGLSSNFFVLSARIVLVLLTLAVILGAWVLVNQANREFRDARQKTNFVANVSHELKTPLTSICMYAEMLQSGRVEDPAKKSHYVDVIVQQSQRLTRLVNNVLAFGRLEQGRERFEMKFVNLKDLVATIMATQQPRLQEAGASLDMKLSQVNAMVDEDAFSQVVLNLLDNGLKYGVDPQGKCRMELELTDTGDKAVLQFSDYGPGVPRAQQKAIFDKFFRGDDSLTRKRDGSGIGLSIAKLLVEGMGGNLTYQEKPGRGACFVVAFPRNV